MKHFSTQDLQLILKDVSRSTVWRAGLNYAAVDSYIEGKVRYFYPHGVSKILNAYGFSFPINEIITVECLKGGVGKSTISICLAYKLAQMGAKVLFIDLDKQSNSTTTITQRETSISKVLFHVVNGDCSLEEAIVETPYGFDAIPSNLKNADVDELLNSHKIPHHRYLRNLLAPVKDKYNYIIIDTSPDLSSSVHVSTLAASKILIPVNLEQYALDGLKMNLRTINEIKDRYKDDNINPSVYILINKVDTRKKSSLELLPNIYQYSDVANILNSMIPVNAEIERISRRGLDFQKKESVVFQEFNEALYELIDLSISSGIKE